jgi:hypothetical protein
MSEYDLNPQFNAYFAVISGDTCKQSPKHAPFSVFSLMFLKFQLKKNLVSDFEVFHYCIPFLPKYMLHVRDFILWSVTCDGLAENYS